MKGLPPCYRCKSQPCQCRDGITIYHGDSYKLLKLISPGDVHFMLTDPPYVISTSGGGIGGKCKHLRETRGFTDCGFDYEVLDRFEHWAVFCGKHQLIDLLQKASCRRWMLVTWNKPSTTPLSNGNYLPDAEYIVHSFPPNSLVGSYHDRSRFVLHHPEKNRFGHPNAKPLAVVSKMIRLTTRLNELVIDPFAGGGTVGRACKDLGRRCIMIEIEEKYCDIAARRLEIPSLGVMVNVEEIQSRQSFGLT